MRGIFTDLFYDSAVETDKEATVHERGLRIVYVTRHL
jgi:hypothetical protein